MNATTAHVPRKSEPAGIVSTASKGMLARPVVAALLLAVVTFALFAPAIRFDFINCDDPDYFAANPHVKAGLTFAGIKWAFTTRFAANWHPLTWLSLMADAQVFGPGAGGPHLTNIVLHALNAAFLFLVLGQLTGKLWPSLVVGALFAWHPAHVESIAWIAERKDVLSTFFGFLALYTYAKYAREQRSEPLRRVSGSSPFTFHVSRFYFLSLGFFALSLMSKPMLVTLPFLLLLLDYWPLRRLSPARLRRQPSVMFRFVFEKAPFLLLSAGSCLVTFVAQKQGKAVSDLVHLPVTSRVENALVSCARYLGKLFWPVDLAIMYPYPAQWRWAFVVFAGFLVAGFCWAAWSLALGRRYVLVGWLWFLGTLVPVIGLVQVGMQSIADRYTYIPSIGLFIVLAWGGHESLRRWRVPRLAIAAGTAVLLAGCIVRAETQLSYWRNTETIFRHALAVTTGNTFAHNNLGCYLRIHERYPEAAEEFEAALRINSNHADVLNNYGYLFSAQKEYDRAIPYYRAALQSNPEHPSARENLADALLKAGKLPEARDDYRALVKTNPGKAENHSLLGIVLASMGNLDDAVGEFREALRLDPEFSAAHCNLGNALAAQHKFDEAIEHLREALRLKPDYPEAQNNLGGALEDSGKLPEALIAYREAARLKPDYAQAHFNLGCTLAKLGQRDEAVRQLGQALRLKPDYAKAKQELRKLGASVPE